MFGKLKKKKVAAKQESADYLVVGLGNPGAQYARTRHNVGFMVIDALAEELGGRYWKDEAGALTCKIENRRDGSLVVLAKPQTFMNLSGSSLKKLCDKYGIIPQENLIVIADELDLPAGEVRLKVGGGHAGHNGHRSIIDSLGTHDYKRIRVGIGRPPGKMNPSDYVLAAMRPQAFEELVKSAFQAAELVKEQLKENLSS